MVVTDRGDADRTVTDLVATLTERTIDPHPERTARHILRHTGGGIRLLGVTTDPAAVCFDPSRCCIYRIPVSPIGTHPTDTTIDWRSVADPRSWIDAASERVAWIHPHFRDVTGDGRTAWRYEHGSCTITPNI